LEREKGEYWVMPKDEYVAPRFEELSFDSARRGEILSLNLNPYPTYLIWDKTEDAIELMSCGAESSIQFHQVSKQEFNNEHIGYSKCTGIDGNGAAGMSPVILKEKF
jgi:hypothetical protein